MSPFRDEPVGRFLEQVASGEPAPGGGAAAAVATALSAALVAMAARLSTTQLDDADTIAATADELRHRALALADEDAAAYRRVLAGYRLPRQPDPEGRQRVIREALEGATAVPLEVARLAAEAAVLGGRLVALGNPNLQGDAVGAVLLAQAAADSAARLVELNVDQGKLDPGWTARAAAHAGRSGGCSIITYRLVQV